MKKFGCILLQDNVLEALWVVFSMIKTSHKLHYQIWHQSWICWKLSQLKWISSNDSKARSYFFWHITFLKGYDAGFPKNSKFLVNLWFKKISGGWLCIWEVPREFGPWIFLVSPILTKLIFLDSVKTKLSEYGVLSWIRFNFSHIYI